MARYSIDKIIDAEISKDTGEVMLSAEDVVGWLRSCATAFGGDEAVAITALADKLAGHWIQAAANCVLGGGD